MYLEMGATREEFESNKMIESRMSCSLKEMPTNFFDNSLA
jgi:hypothetical protein